MFFSKNRTTICASKGQDFVQYAQGIIDDFDRLQTIGHDMSNANVTHTLSISSMNYRTLVLLAAEFYNQFPPESLRLIIHEYDRDGVINSVMNWDSEIGVLNILSSYQKDIIKQLKSKNLCFTELSNDIPVVLISERHPLYLKGDFATISPKDLTSYPLVRYSTMDYTHYGDKAHLVGITEYAGEIIVANSTGYIMADEYKAAMAELMPLLDEIVAEAEKPMPPKPLEPPANPRVWRPRKPQVSKRKPRDTLSHGTVPESDLQSSTKDTIR